MADNQQTPSTDPANPDDIPLAHLLNAAGPLNEAQKTEIQQLKQQYDGMQRNLEEQRKGNAPFIATKGSITNSSTRSGFQSERRKRGSRQQ